MSTQGSGNGNGSNGNGDHGSGGSHADDDVAALLTSAGARGLLGSAASSVLGGHLGKVVIAGAAGTSMEDIVASDVTLVTVLIDASSSIAARGLEQAIRDGQNLLVDAFAGSTSKDSILMALWTFESDTKVVHSYVPVDEADRLSASNYSAAGATRLYDTWCDALASNVAYAERLRASGTPCRSVAVVITDGEDVGSRRTQSDCASVSRDLLASEQFVLAFVGVGNDVDFFAVARGMGLPDANVSVQSTATPAALRRTFQMVSQSVIRASQARVQPGAATGFFVP